MDDQLSKQTRIKHIVMWKLKDYAEGADKAANMLKLKALLETCRNIVPGLVTLEVGLATAELEATYDVVLYSEFTDKTALDAYQDHPTHQAMKPFIGAIRLERQCMDYEV